MRLFIGCRIPPLQREHIRHVLTSINLPGDLKEVESEKWHFTLTFLGEVEESHVPALHVLIEKALEKAPRAEFRFTKLSSFPYKQPHLIALEAETDPRDEWSVCVSQLREMVSVMAPDIDRKQWRPHITIARAKRDQLFPAWEQLIAPIEWRPQEVALICTEQHPQEGVRYQDLHVFPLNI